MPPYEVELLLCGALILLNAVNVAYSYKTLVLQTSELISAVECNAFISVKEQIKQILAGQRNDVLSNAASFLTQAREEPSDVKGIRRKQQYTFLNIILAVLAGAAWGIDLTFVIFQHVMSNIVSTISLASSLISFVFAIFVAVWPAQKVKTGMGPQTSS